MDISVIVPIYGVEKYIEKSLKSLFSQTKTDGVEYILVNDCTKDSSIKIAEGVISNYANIDVKIINHEINKGITRTRQTGLDKAQGSYIMYIDSDDWCEPTMLEDLYNCAINNDAEIVVCDYYLNFSTSQTYQKQQAVKNNGIECVRMLLDGSMMGFVWNKLIKRSLFIDNDLRWVPKIDLWEDLLISVKLFSCTNRVAYLPKAFVHYVQNSVSICHSMTERHIDMTVSAVALMEEFLAEQNLSSILRDSIKYRKVIVLSGALISLDRLDTKKYISLYLDISNSILKSKLPIYYRISTYAAYHNCIFISSIINFCIGILKRYVQRLS